MNLHIRRFTPLRILLIAFLVAGEALGHAGCPGEAPAGPILEGAVVQDTMAALGRVGDAPPGDCFASLTNEDHAFLNELSGKLATVCRSAPASDCAGLVKDALNAGIESYRYQQGTIAAHRVQLALAAAFDQQQAEQAVRNLERAGVEHEFARFAATAQAFRKARDAAAYSDGSGRAPGGMGTRLAQWAGRTKDNLLPERGPLARLNRRVPETQLAMELSFAHSALLGAVLSSKLPENERNLLASQVRALYSALREETEAADTPFMETNQAVGVGALALGSLALLVGGVTMVSTAALGGATVRQILIMVLKSSPQVASGLSGMTDVAGGVARTRWISNHENGRFFCELRKEFKDEDFNVAKGMVIGGARGLGADAGVALGIFIARRFRYGGIAVGTVAAVTAIGTSVYNEYGSAHEQNTTLPANLARMAADGATPGEIKDAEIRYGADIAKRRAVSDTQLVVTGTAIWRGATLFFLGRP